jgi:hypothetical protein
VFLWPHFDFCFVLYIIVGRLSAALEWVGAPCCSGATSPLGACRWLSRRVLGMKLSFPSLCSFGGREHSMSFGGIIALRCPLAALLSGPRSPWCHVVSEFVGYRCGVSSGGVDGAGDLNNKPVCYRGLMLRSSSGPMWCLDLVC